MKRMRASDVSRFREEIAAAARRLAEGTPTIEMPGFDAAFYAQWYPDVVEAKADPLTHYLEHGWKEGRDPCRGFSTRGYLQANPDVLTAQIPPLVHFLTYGIAEGRRGWSKDPTRPPARPTSAENSAALAARSFITGQDVADDAVAGEDAPSSGTLGTIEDELIRLAATVNGLTARGRPVKLHFGAGTTPRRGFLNIDRGCAAPQFLETNFHEFFSFPFAEMPWGIPSDSVDYIFHEDFIEHIDQTAQFQFLAESLRVLKSGSWHRVNTPDLMWTLKTRSDFRSGFDGVYTGERQWEHISLFSHRSLEDVARAVGYSDVVFTTRDNGVSPYAIRDFRPQSDRDSVTGNIYADLKK